MCIDVKTFLICVFPVIPTHKQETLVWSEASSRPAGPGCSSERASGDWLVLDATPLTNPNASSYFI